MLLGLPRPQGCQAHHPPPDLLVVPVFVLVIVLLLVVIFPPVLLLGLGPAECAEDATEVHRSLAHCRGVPLVLQDPLGSDLHPEPGHRVAGSAVAVEDGLTVLQVRGESRSASGHGDQETQGCNDSERAPGG